MIMINDMVYALMKIKESFVYTKPVRFNESKMRKNRGGERMSKKKTHEEYVAELAIKNPNVEVVGQYVDNRTKILHHCLIHDVFWMVAPSNVLIGRGCLECRKEKIRKSKLKTHEEYVIELAISNPTVDVVGDYIDAKTKISHLCKIHNVLWDISPDGALAGYGCPECHKERKSLSMRKTRLEYIAELSIKNPTVKLIGEYINATTKTLHYCTIHDEYWDISSECALRGQGCSYCRIERLKEAMTWTHEYYVEKLSVNNPDVEVVGAYINTITPILHYCKKHKLYWDIAPYSALQGCGCPECHKERISTKLRKSQEQYEIDVANVNPDIIVVGEYVHSHLPLLHECKKCGFVWPAHPSGILNGEGCPQCRESRGEKDIKKYLNIHNISYIPQYRFKDCKYKKPLSFDFYLPQYNTCIEYQGEQHYRVVDFFGGKDEFELRKKRDEIKRNYCYSNNIRLLYISYREDIAQVLDEFFSFEYSNITG